MIIVASLWEFGWNTPIKEFDLWHYPLKEFGVDELAMVPVSGIKKKMIREFHNIQDLVEYYDLPLIICSENGQESLTNFEHPKDGLYLFNRTSGGNFPFLADYSLRIDTPNDKGMIWGHQAASIILYDRFLKGIK